AARGPAVRWLDSREVRRRGAARKTTQPGGHAPDGLLTPRAVGWLPVRLPRRLLRPIGVLAGLCVLLGVVTAGMVFPLAGGLGMLSNEAGDSVTSSSVDLVNNPAPLTTTVTDSDGQPLAYLFDQNRTEVPNEQISPAMKAAILAIEDRRFYD